MRPGNVILDGFRGMFFFLDKIIYPFIVTLFDLFFDLANMSIFSNDAIKDFTSRIYTILGVFMLFKVTFSLITYVINPDQFLDKNKGVQHLIQNIIVSLAFLIISPWAFDKLMEVQYAILEDNLIPRFITGTTSSSNDSVLLQFSPICTTKLEVVDETESMALTILRPFLQVTDGISDSKVDPTYCGGADLTKTTSKSFMNGISINDTQGHSSGKMYIYDYLAGISTVVGIIVCLILISFCFDVAVRSIQLGFLQIIAPIPIISYIDPDSGKKGMFKKWLTQVGKTWASLFIRLASIFLAIYIIGLIDLREMVRGDGQPFSSSTFWLQVFIILAALIFAKQLPKLLEEILGIKLDGNFQLNPFKKLEKEALGGKLLANTGKMATGAAVGLGLGVAGAATGAGVGRILTGTLSGASQGLKGKKFGDIHSSQVAANDRMRTAILNGSTFGGRMGQRVSGALGTGGESARIAREKENIDVEIRKQESIIKRLDDEMAPDKAKIETNKKLMDSIKQQETRAVDKIKNGEAGTISETYLNLQNDYEKAKNEGRTTDATSLYQQMNDFLNNDGMRQYIDNVQNGVAGFDDKALKGMIDDYNALAALQGRTVYNNAADRHSQHGSLAGENSDTARRMMDKEQEKARATTEKSRQEQKKYSGYTDRERVSKANTDATKGK